MGAVRREAAVGRKAVRARMLRRAMSLQGNRVLAAVLALIVTAGIVAAIVVGTGDRSGGGVSAALAQSESYCADFDSGAVRSASARIYTGRYSNPAYGYAVTIPPGLSGYVSAAAAPRGFFILLSATPRALLRVDAAYDALYDITAAGVHTRNLMDVRLFDRLLADHSEPYSLAAVAAGRYRMQVLCRGKPSPYLFDEIIAVRNREIYRLDLQTEPQRAAQDETLLEAMARSWSWIP